MTSLPNLFSPLAIGECTIPNRIVFSGHHTYLADRIPGDSLIAYLEARAKGGVGLIVSEVVAVHESAGFASKLLVADSADVVPHYRRLTDACKAHGTAIFAQLFHPGREVLATASGMAPLAFAPSATPNERFHIMPKPLSVNMIESIINGYGNAATHLAAAGFDGFEIVASHGYLPAQFINPRVNLRDDDYGGDFARRCKFLREVATRVRDCAPQKVLGLRISAAELDGDGLSEDEIIKVCEAFAGVFDYFSVTLGTSSGLKGAVHIAPPMGVDIAYIAPFARRLREAVDAPIIATGRINQPQDAEQILARGDADLCGMTRALICDAALPAKARAGDLDAIRACIGCNQSCIGRAHKGLGVSCIQHPESGREVEFAATPKVVTVAKKILVAGGGVAGLKAAAVAASRGHTVTLCEKQNALGGQSNLACRLPGRAEFGGIVNNLKREAEVAGVIINLGVKVDAKFIADNQYDDIIIATGATPYHPDIAGVSGDNVVNAWQIISGEIRAGARVVIADWKGDWIGFGVAEMLAASGSRVTLCVNAAQAGDALQIYTRNHYLARVKKLGVEIHTHLRWFGVDDGAVYFQDVLTEEATIFDDVDSVVFALGHASDNELEHELGDEKVHVIGDCLLPRSAEEAVYEGLLIGRKI